MGPRNHEHFKLFLEGTNTRTIKPQVKKTQK